MEKDIKIFAVRHLFREGWGERIRLIHHGTKRRAFKERGPLERFSLERQIQRNNHDLALLLGNGVMIVDKDGPEQGPFAELTSPMTSITDRGQHLWFQTDIDGTNKIKYLGLEVDVLWNGIASIPPNETATGMVRTWVRGTVRPEVLPMFPKDLIREEPKPEHKIYPPSEIPVTAQIIGMRRWIAKVLAVHGSGTADKNTYRVAIKIASVIKDFDQALAELVAWDRTNSTPPMSDTAQGMKALEHKVRCAIDYLAR